MFLFGNAFGFWLWWLDFSFGDVTCSVSDEPSSMPESSESSLFFSGFYLFFASSHHFFPIYSRPPELIASSLFWISLSVFKLLLIIKDVWVSCRKIDWFEISWRWLENSVLKQRLFCFNLLMCLVALWIRSSISFWWL